MQVKSFIKVNVNISAIFQTHSDTQLRQYSVMHNQIGKQESMTENEKIDEIIAYAIKRQGRFWGNDFLNQGGTGRDSRGTKTSLTYVDVNRIIALLKSKGVAESVDFGSDNDFNLLGDWNELQKGWEHYQEYLTDKANKTNIIIKDNTAPVNFVSGDNVGSISNSPNILPKYIINSPSKTKLTGLKDKFGKHIIEIIIGLTILFLGFLLGIN